ncbi:AAA family ATPase, partial [Massilibacteroides sp.]|uniref:AAA family ATPase n=1 Tax=Massilibacteroides sp. TaxID=2034766 RepID=UPI0026156C54
MPNSTSPQVFKYTEEQQEIVDYLREQLKPEGENVVVSGAGGTGKTAMLCNFIGDLIQEGYSVAATAMTGKATAVLRNKIYTALKERGMKVPDKNVLLIETITKLTKKSSVLGLSENGETVYSKEWRNPEDFPYQILFVDEMSMVYHVASLWWQRTKARVFGFGDFCQLPEVTTAESR